ncbi:uncharacterized protein LOC111633562 [Centruroides sculpturatus]|uniref:uncharacterized protein LOC111633562 n=1 Tax=Centruroides sculpturatus TaxID=218467 RepID=UPI000C6D8AFE|nr:uncharacterized protein LOC111633562 [Centruroides sculpturatus]
MENDRATPMLDSAQYLSKLESRLARIKDKNKEPTPKEILTSLQQAKESILGIERSQNESSSFLSEESGDKQVSSSSIERYLFPEKQAIIIEEIQHLLQYDTLAKTTAEIANEVTNSECKND